MDYLQYYKTFTNILKPRFLKTFQSLYSEQHPPKQLLEAHITVIPKEGKDLTQVTNYRPISLINVDIKIYAKILANRLLPLLSSLISLDKVVFIPGREGRDNTIKAININHWLSSQKKPGFFLSLDAEKAFDRVAWDYMDAVLKHIGILPQMRSYIKVLYSNPTARVRVNGHLSDAFNLHNGTRQGCPLSPLLFVITLEPLLNKIRSNPDIKGIEIHKHTYKVAAFADDMLLFLSEPHISLPNVIQDLEHFQLLSNLKINHSKSSALNITLPSNSVELCKNNFPFSWAKQSITYLGTEIPTNLSNLFKLNFLPILKDTQDDLKRWNSLNISWFGRASLIKMTILPRFLYVMQTIPIRLPLSFFNTFRKACSSFIWRSKPPRIKFTRLNLPKNKGGIALPDLQKYHQAALLTRIVDWNIHQTVKDWVSLEQSLFSHQINYLPWIRPAHHSKNIKTHPLIGPTLEIFFNTYKKNNPVPWMSPLTPLRNNPDFVPGLEKNVLTNSWPHGEILVKHFFKNGKLLSRDEINRDSDPPQISQWNYIQIRHYLTSNETTQHWTRPLTTLEDLCTRTTPQRHIISFLYNSLFVSNSVFSSSSYQAWEQDLNLNLSEENWEKIFMYAHKGSLNVATQECCFKIITRWYRTPSLLHKFSPRTSDRCWRCKIEEGSMIHIWWTCPLIQNFWKMVHETITSVTSENLSFNPAQYLLHYNSIPKRQYLKSLTMFMINAARHCIPCHWQSNSIPSKIEWFRRINKIESIKELISISQEKILNYASTWHKWIEFKNSQSYKAINI